MNSFGLSRFVLTTSILIALLVAIFLFSMSVGTIPLEPGRVLRTILGSGSAEEELVVFDFRLPRIVIALLIGTGLASSGAILQCIARNDLADPGIIGINAGAGLAVLLFFSFFPVNQAAPSLFVPMVAFAGGMGAALLIFALAYTRDDGIAPMRLILIGIAIAAGIGAAMYALTIRLNNFVYRFVETWLAGSIWATGWSHVRALLPWILILLPFAVFRSRTLDILRLHEHIALGLGASLNRERPFSLRWRWPSPHLVLPSVAPLPSSASLPPILPGELWGLSINIWSLHLLSWAGCWYWVQTPLPGMRCVSVRYRLALSYR